VDHLALQVRIVNDVGIDNPERAHSSGREIERCGGPQSTRSDQKDLGVEKLALALLTDFRDQQVATISPALIRRQGLWDTPGQS
jgi:hypothetical protein